MGDHTFTKQILFNRFIYLFIYICILLQTTHNAAIEFSCVSYKLEK